MILLHTSFVDRLYLWTEASVDDRLAPIRSTPVRGRSGVAHTRHRRFPFDGGAPALLHAATELDAAIGTDRILDAIIHLPTRRDQPIPSSSLVAEPIASKARPRFRPFALAVLELDEIESLAVLEHATDGELLAPGLIAGSTLLYCVEVCRLATRLVVRQRYLPGVVAIGDDWFARWEPVLLDAEDARRFVELERSMPDALRALTPPGHGSSGPPATPRGDVLHELLATFIDALVRRSLDDIEYRNWRQRLGVDGSRQPFRRATVFESIDDQWHATLMMPTATNAPLRVSAEEIDEFRSRLESWKRPLALNLAASTRLCFRLEEPPEQAPRSRWRVRYLLQSVEDPSLQVPVADLFSQHRGQQSRTARDAAALLGTTSREYALSALGSASRLVPEVERSLHGSIPDGYTLDIHGAYEFLHRHALALRQAGFTVMLPSWWSGVGTRLCPRVRGSVTAPGISAPGGLSLDAIARVDWTVVLGDEPMSMADLRRLARQKAPLVRLRGSWVEVDAQQIEAAIGRLKERSRELTVHDVIATRFGTARAMVDLDVESIDANGVLGEFIERLEGRRPEALPVPEGFVGTLRPYQHVGFSWLGFLCPYGLGACLADDMGLGKTIQTLVHVASEIRYGENRPVLLVCPTSVMGNWAKEAERFTPDLDVMIHHGTGRTTEATFVREAERHAMVITSYGLLHRDLRRLAAVDWAGVVLDEAQNIKNPNTKVARAARSLAAGYRIALTGTPVENHVMDLWSIMEFLNPGFLGSQTSFRRDFFMPIQMGHDPDVTARLRALTGPFVLRRVKTDRSIIADLPEKQEMKVFCTLTREQATLYRAVVDEMTGALDDVEGIQRRGIVLAGLSKLKQVCNHPAQFLGDNSRIEGRSGKLTRLVEMLEEIVESGERALVFSQFAEMGAIIKRHIEQTLGVETLFLYGATSRTKRDGMIERFQSGNGAPPVFVLSLKAGGTGLNLTAANHVFHFDRWWNPAVEQQATDRAFRIGQTRNVQVHKFLCVGTVEERIDEMIERKQEVAESIVGNGEGWITELSTDELRSMLRLRRTP